MTDIHHWYTQFSQLQGKDNLLCSEFLLIHQFNLRKGEKLSCQRPVSEENRTLVQEHHLL